MSARRRAPSDGATFDVIVIGAGYGGVTAAAVLASRGQRVLLVDKNGRAGGKAMRAVRPRDGVVHDLWPIAGGPTRGSRFDDLVRLLGLPEQTLIEPDPAAEFSHIGPDGIRRSFRVPGSPIRDPLALFRIARAFGVSPLKLGGLLCMNLKSALLRGPLLDRYDNVSMADFLRDHDLPGPIHDWLTSLMNLFFVVPVDRLPASEAIWTLRAIAAGGAGRYHRGGYGAVAEAAVDFVEAHGGIWLPSTRVKRIAVEKGRVAGIETSRGFFHAPVVISNAGIQPTVMNLVGEESFSDDYVSRVRRLEPSWAFVGVRYDLSEPFFDVPMTVICSPQSGWDSARFGQAEIGNWPENPLLFVTVPSLYDPSLASQGTPQVALVGVLGSPDPAARMNTEAIGHLERMVDRLWPTFREKVTRRQAFGADAVASTTRDNVMGHGGACIGLGQLIGQCGRSKPDFRAPLPGLYYVGCDAGGRGIGTTQAVDSGYNVAAGVLKDRGWGGHR